MVYYELLNKTPPKQQEIQLYVRVAGGLAYPKSKDINNLRPPPKTGFS